MAPTMRKIGTDVFSVEPEYPSRPEKRFSHIEFNREEKREVNAYKLKKCLEDVHNEKKIEKLTSDSQNGFSYLVKITERSENFLKLTSIVFVERNG